MRLNRYSAIALLILFYIYMPFIWTILDSVFGIPVFLKYLLYLLLIALSIIVSPCISENVLKFAAGFIIVLFTNYIFVDYRYYVFVEGLEAFILLMTPCLCISNAYFKLELLIKKWYKFSLMNFPLVILSIILFNLKLVNYSIFTSICVPNVFILAYGLMEFNVRLKPLLFLIISNIIVTITLGGRMAALVTVVMFALAFWLSSNIRFFVKVILTGILVFFSILVMINLQVILSWLQDVLDLLDIESRSLVLLLQQFNSGVLYTTNRSELYSIIIDYIKVNFAFPGGFGVVLNLTGGRFYYAHNIILQLLIVFGVPITILICIILFQKLFNLYYHGTKSAFRFMMFMGISYFIIGMTGSSIFIHYLSTIFISLLFFKENHLRYLRF